MTLDGGAILCIPGEGKKLGILEVIGTRGEKYTLPSVDIELVKSRLREHGETTNMPGLVVMNTECSILSIPWHNISVVVHDKEVIWHA